MRVVTQEFLKALESGSRHLETKVFMVFQEFSQYCTGNAPTYDWQQSIFSTAQVYDNRISMQDFMGRPKRFLVAVDENDPDWKPTAADNCVGFDDTPEDHPAITDLVLSDELHTPEYGWWSVQQSDDSGDCDVWLSLQLTQTISMNAFWYVGDPVWGYPVDADFYVVNNGVQTLAASVTGNDTYFIFAKSTQYLDADVIKVHVTKWSRVNSHVKCLEFTPIDGDDVSARVIKWEILEERNFDDSQILPYGDSSKNKITLNLHNTDSAFYSRNVYSPYYRKLRPNVKFRVFLGLELADGTMEWTNRGAFYAIGNFASSLKKADCEIEAWDYSSQMDQNNFTAPVIYTLKDGNPNTILQIIDQVLSFYNASFNTHFVVENRTKFDDKGRYVSDWDSIFSYSSSYTPSSGVPYAYLPNDTYFNTLRSLADSILGWFSVSEEETLVIDTEFMAKRVFNALTNGNFESANATDGWTVESGATLSFASQRLVFNGANSGLLQTTFQESGIRQDFSDVYGIDGDYTFRMWYNVSYGTMHCQVVGLDSQGLARETYYDNLLTASSWSHVYQDFTVGNGIQSVEIRLRQSGNAPGYFLLDDIYISTRAAYSFVGEIVPGYGMTLEDSNVDDIEDKFSVDKLKNQIIIEGIPYRLGLGERVASWDGNTKVYYGSYFPSTGSWVETIGLGYADERVVGGKFQLTLPDGTIYRATVSGNDPTTGLYGPIPQVTETSGSWAILNASYYYRATACTTAGESTLGPTIALSFSAGQQQPQVNLPALQDAQWYRIYRSLSSFDSGQTVSYINVGVGPGTQAAWPAGTLAISPTADNAGNKQLVFLDPESYTSAKATPSINTATKAPVIYLQTPPLDSNSFMPVESIVGYSWIVYPFENVYSQQDNTTTEVSIAQGASYSYVLTHSKTPVFINTSPTSWTKIQDGLYQTIEGIQVGFNTLNDSGALTPGIDLDLDLTLSQIYPYGATLVFVNTRGDGPRQPYSLHIEAPVLDQSGGIQAIAQSLDLIKLVGLKQQSYASTFVQNPTLAQALSDRVLDRWTKTGMEYDVNMPNRAPLHLQLGDKAALWDQHTFLYGAHGLILRLDTTYDGGASTKASVLMVD